MNNTNQKFFENSITLVRVSDGESASSYSVDTNYSEVLKFVKIENGEEKTTFSPSSLEFKVFDFIKGENLSDFYWNVSYLNPRNNEFEKISERGQNSYPKYFIYGTPNQASPLSEDSGASDGISETTLTFRLAAFYESRENSSFIQAIDANAPLKFVCFDGNNNKILATKIITIQNGVSADMAKLNIGAAGIVASIRDASLKFDADGLTVQNGYFVIEREYARAIPQPTSDEEFRQKVYYYKESNGSKESYQKADTYVSDEIYYIKVDEKDKKIFYADDEGNLTIVGNVHANDGYFNGEVHATSGTFKGEITSEKGLIGGFTIDGNSIVSINNTIQLKSKVNAETNIDESEIIAGKITIVEGSLTDKIVIWKNELDENERVVLSNPTANDGKVLESGLLTLKNNGYLSLGNIEMYGGSHGALDGYIRSSFTDEAGLKQNGFWKINENGTAYFDQIHANNAKIQNSVLEINTIQTVGSLMLFKDSWPVVQIENYQQVQFDNPKDTSSEVTVRTASKIYIEGRTSLIKGDYLYANDSYYLVEEVTFVEYYEAVEEINEQEITYELTKDIIYQPNKQYFMKNSDENFEPVKYSNFITIVRLLTTFNESNTIVTKIGQIKNKEKAVFANRFTEGVQYYSFEKAEANSQNTGSYYEWFSSGFIKTYDNLPTTTGKNYYTKNELKVNSQEDFQRHYDQKNIYTIITTTTDGDQMLSILGESRKGNDTGIQDFAVGNSLTISEISDLGGKLGFIKHLILGDLSETGIDTLIKIGGWGLYCDNVYLNGALITENLNTYAGINTKSGVPFTKAKQGQGGQETLDQSNIIFWGGANDMDDSSIQTAKFQVSAGGTLYAQDAIIENSIFSGADIYSARLFTAEIHGSDGQLTIYESSNGITFKKETEDEIYALKDNGFFHGQKAFINIPATASEAVWFNGNFLSQEGTKQVALRKGALDFSHEVEDVLQNGSIGFQLLEENLNIPAMQFTVGKGINNKPQMEIRRDKAIIKTEANFEGNVLFSTKMRYNKVNYGYDLYVYE